MSIYVKYNNEVNLGVQKYDRIRNYQLLIDCQFPISNYALEEKKDHPPDFELKYCLAEEDKATASWVNFNFNSDLKIDDSGNGNASGSYTPSEAQNITTRFIKLKIYMKDN